MNKEALDARTRAMSDQAWAAAHEARSELAKAHASISEEPTTFENRMALLAIQMVLVEVAWRELEAES